MSRAVTDIKPHHLADSPAIGPIERGRKGRLEQMPSHSGNRIRKRRYLRYLGVPVTVYHDLMSAESKARFYDSNIKGHYCSVLVRARQKEQVTN